MSEELRPEDNIPCEKCDGKGVGKMGQPDNKGFRNSLACRRCRGTGWVHAELVALEREVESLRSALSAEKLRVIELTGLRDFAVEAGRKNAVEIEGLKEQLSAEKEKLSAMTKRAEKTEAALKTISASSGPSAQDKR